MNLNRICLNCGSSAFVSDRSLGGKIVCSRCGSSSFSNQSFPFFNKKILLFFALGIIIFLIII